MKYVREETIVKKKGFYFYSIQKIIQKFAAKKEQFAKKFNSSQNTCLS